MKAKKTRVAIIVLTAISGISATLGTMPIDSEHLPMPPEIRPYIISIGFFGTVVGLVANSVISMLQAIDKEK